jgi:hypothetical protein
MTQRLRNRLIEAFTLFLIAGAAAVLMPRAHAEMIGIDATERERVKALLERPEVVKQLGDLGVSADDAKARVDAMTDGEVLQLAGRIDQAIAGGQLRNDQLVIILLLVVLLILLL